MPEQIITEVSTAELSAKIEQLKKDNYRIVQICAARIADRLELSYSFDKDYQLVTLRLLLPLSGAQVQSVSGIYLSAFLYENEIHDLYGVSFPGLAIDFAGNLYRTAVKTPFNPPGTTTGEAKA